MLIIKGYNKNTFEKWLWHFKMCGGRTVVPEFHKLYDNIEEVIDHGDLIDRDALLNMDPWQWGCDPYEVGGVKQTIEEQLVIIPAERNDSICAGCERQNEKGCSWCPIIMGECENENWYTEFDDPKIAERSEDATD